MHWQTLQQVWNQGGKKVGMKVRFNDWSHQYKYFVVTEESSDGKRLLGNLDSGEKISFAKNSRGWSHYVSEDEILTAHAV